MSKICFHVIWHYTLYIIVTVLFVQVIASAAADIIILTFDLGENVHYESALTFKTASAPCLS